MSEDFGVQCETCGGEARIKCRRAASEPGWMVTASCHGMYMVRMARRDGDLEEVLSDVHLLGARLPPLLPEFVVDPETPSVKVHTWKPVRPELEPHLRLGMMVEIDGERGIVIGHDMGKHRCMLGALATGDDEERGE